MVKKTRKKNRLKSEAANKYDKILKENFIKSLPGLIFYAIDEKVANLKQINPELQHTRERKADYIGILTNDQGEIYIIHIEFQVRNDSKMKYRMLEYRAMLRRRFPKLAIRQLVIYLGKSSPNMETIIDEPNLNYKFDLVWSQKFHSKTLIESDVPELILMAVLADFGEGSPEIIAEKIIQKIKSKAKTQLEFERFTTQLRVLSNIRNLQPLIDEIMENISRFFVPERDPWFVKGKLEGVTEKTKTFVENLLLDGSFSIEKIALLADVTEEYVLQTKQVMKHS